MEARRLVSAVAAIALLGCGGGSSDSPTAGDTSADAASGAEPSASSATPESAATARPTPVRDEEVSLDNQVVLSVVAPDGVDAVDVVSVRVSCERPPQLVTLSLRPWAASARPQLEIVDVTPTPGADGEFVVEMTIPAWVPPGDKQIDVVCDRSVANPTERFTLRSDVPVGTWGSWMVTDLNAAVDRSGVVSGTGVCPVGTVLGSLRMVAQELGDGSVPSIVDELATQVQVGVSPGSFDVIGDAVPFEFSFRLGDALMATAAAGTDLVVGGFCESVDDDRIAGVEPYDPFLVRLFAVDIVG